MHGQKNIKLCNAEQAKRVYQYKEERSETYILLKNKRILHQVGNLKKSSSQYARDKSTILKDVKLKKKMLFFMNAANSFINCP